MSASSRRLDLLLICNFEPRQAQTCKDHIGAFAAFSQHNVHIYSGLGDLPDDLELERFDGVILHYTISVRLDTYLSPLARYRLRCFGGLKAMFIQDEYREINDSIEAIDYLGIDLLFTCIPEGEIEKVYSAARLPHLKCVNVLTGYVPRQLLDKEVPIFSNRALDVGYRGRIYPAWHGDLGREKWLIAENFLRDAPEYNLSCDISVRERDRIYGKKWIDFLTNCKAVLAVESGAGIFDFTGQIARSVEAHVARQSGHSSKLSYEDLKRLYFLDEDGRIRLNQISPRCFEAAALGTLIIAYEGDYSQVLEPWRHFVPLKKDHSNMGEVVAVLRDQGRAEGIIKMAYEEVACNAQYSYRGFMQHLDRELETLAKPDCRQRPIYQKAEFIRRFGRYDRSLRRHLIKSLVIRKIDNFGRRRVLPVLPRRLHPAVKKTAGMLVKKMAKIRAGRRRKAPDTQLPAALGSAINSPQEREEVMRLLALINQMAALSKRAKQQILAVRFDASTGCLTLSPGGELSGETPDSSLEQAVKAGRVECIKWLPGSLMGPAVLTPLHEVAQFPAIVDLIRRKPDLIRFFYPGDKVFSTDRKT